MTINANTLITKLDELLRNDEFDTRAGLSFMGQLVKDAFTFIEEQRTKNERETSKLDGYEFRLTNMEKGLRDWMDLRAAEKKEADEERKFFRRATVGGIIAIVLSELTRWVLG